MTYRKLLQILIVIGFTVLAGCVQRETDIGIAAAGDQHQHTFADTSLYASAWREWVPPYSNGLGDYLEIGEADSLKAFFVARFNPVAATSDSFRADSVVFVLKRLPTCSVYPEDGAVPIDIRVREVTEFWKEDSLVPGTLPNHDSYPILPGSFTMFPTTTDTSYSYVVPLDLFNRWLVQDSTTWGLLFEPINRGALYILTSENYANEISGSDTLILAPQLFIHGKVLRTSDSLWVDTLFTQKPVNDAYLATDESPPIPGELAVRQGSAERLLLYFPVTSNLFNFTRVVSHAEMILYADTSNPANLVFKSTSCSNLLFKDGTLTDSTWISQDTVQSYLIATTSTAYDSTDSYLKFNLSTTVGTWFGDPAKNTGIQVLNYGENQFLARQFFYGPDYPDSTKRPRLRIWYTEF